MANNKKPVSDFASGEIFQEYAKWLIGLVLITSAFSLSLGLKSAGIVLGGGMLVAGIAYLMRKDPAKAIFTTMLIGVFCQIVNLEVHRDSTNIGVIWFLATVCFASFTGSLKSILWVTAAAGTGIVITGLRAPASDPMWSHPMTFPNLLGMLAVCAATSIAVQRFRMKREAELNKALTDVEALADDLAKANESLKQSEQSKLRLLETMSHELRTPMMTIAVAAERLAEKGLNADNQQTMAAIERSARNVSEIMNDVLDLGAVYSGHAKVTNETFELFPVIQGACEIAQVAQPDVVLVIDVLPETPAKWAGDVARLRQIVLNLTKNALIHSGSECVRVQLRKAADEGLCLRVEDWGKGIEDKDIGSLFDPYVRTGAASSGTGLGLSITKEYVELLSGRISVQSTPGEGTNFEVCVPFKAVGHEIVADRFAPPSFSGARLELNPKAKEAMEPWLAFWSITEDSDASISISERDNGRVIGVLTPEIITNTSSNEAVEFSGDAVAHKPNGKQCLVVEDEVLLTDLLSQYLQDHGFTVRSAYDGEGAISLLGEQSIDVVVVDMNMPGKLSGLDVIKSAADLETPPLICGISGLATYEEAAREAGADLFFRKPFSLALFVEEVSGHLASK